MKKITIDVPATSANIGSGFDSVGLAVGLWNRVELEPADSLKITCADGTPIPTDEHNLVYRTVKKLFDEAGRSLPGLSITQYNPIPMTRGLGSSSACIVAGLLGGNRLLGELFTREQLIETAVSIEGHPDNVMPAFLGGITASVVEGGRVYHSRMPIPVGLRFLAVIPDIPLETEKARAALPVQVSRSDAVYNLSRAALLTMSLVNREYSNLRAACGDCLHQPYRLKLIDGGWEAIELLYSNGAYAAYISGAGSTLMGILPAASAENAAKKVAAALTAQGRTSWQVKLLEGNNTGAVVT